MCRKHEPYRDPGCPLCKLEAHHEAAELRLLNRVKFWRKVSEVMYWTVAAIAVAAATVTLTSYFFGGTHASP